MVVVHVDGLNCRLLIRCCDGVRLRSQNCGLGPTVLFPSDSDVDLVEEIG
jgi:hypothetical protein